MNKPQLGKISSLCIGVGMLFLNGCATSYRENSNIHLRSLPSYHGQAPFSSRFNEEQYAQRLPSNIDTNGKKIILVDPHVRAWGAYDQSGQLVKAGVATAGADFCKDIDRPCRTSVGSFRITRMGDEECVSKRFPLGKGGALMPFCMYFNGGQSLHGSPDQLMMSDENISHGCVHLRIPDAEWLRYHFATLGTKVIVLPYS